MFVSCVLSGLHCLLCTNKEYYYYIYLSLLFNCMLGHGYNAGELIRSSIISIPKDVTASICNNDNYRGISLFNSISKLYDYVILDICSEYLNISDLQFGYKKQHSTVMCSLVYHEVVTSYMRNKSNVYSCLLDASKAFDRIHYGKMFSILLHKKSSLLYYTTNSR